MTGNEMIDLARISWAWEPDYDYFWDNLVDEVAELEDDT